MKSVFGVIGAVVPVVYFGGLLYYFLHLSGSVEEAKTIGLGPTLLGLGVVGLLFCIPLIVKIVRLFARPRRPGGADASTHDDGFDADAVLARYMARRSAEVDPGSPDGPHARREPAKRSSFGRRIT